MKKQLKKRRVIPVALALLVLVIGSGVAYAYWTATGSGSGTASTISGVTDLTVTQVGTLAAMYPGDSDQTTHVTITNTSLTQSVHVLTVSISNVTTDHPLCTSADFVPGPAVTPWGALGLEIAHGVTTGTVNGPLIHFYNDPVNPQDACMGAVVTVHYSVS